MRTNRLEWKDQLMTGRVYQIVAIVYAAVLAIIVMYSNLYFYHDDAYITLRYVRNYINGFGLVWNPHEYVQGYTNFLYLVFVTTLRQLGVNMLWATRIVSVAALVGLLVVVAQFGVILRNEGRNSVWHIPLILVMTSCPILVWSLGGLEGTLFALLVAAGGLFFLMATDSPDAYWLYAASGVLLGLGFLTRPDGIVFISVTLAWLFPQALKNKSRGFFKFVACLAGVVIIAAPYVLWQKTYYGDLVPNAFYAKVGEPLRLRLDSGARYMLSYLVRPPFLPALVCGSLVYALMKHRWSPKLTYLAISVSAYLTFIVLAGGDHMPSFRLFVPVIPLMSAMVALALSLAIESKHRATGSFVTLVILIVTTLQLRDTTLDPREEDPAAFVGTVVGKHIAEAWPSGSLVALNTAGSTPYYAASHRYIDMLGLNDRVIARRRIEKAELPWQRVPGHLKGDGAYVLSRRPDYIILGPAGGTTDSRPWFLSDLELSRDPSFQRDYVKHKVRLDPKGHETTGPGLTFTYYQRVGSRE